jgi:hypothetical protein
LELLCCQVKNRQRKANCWTRGVKILALKIFYRNPAEYRTLRNALSLPGVTTLKTFVAKNIQGVSSM